MEDYKVKNNYLISCISCILILMTICYFGMNFLVKDTFAGFGGITGCMGANIDLEYNPNYPDGFEMPEVITKKVCSSNIILDNMYDVPLGYEFKGWNTNIDGTGNMYYANSIMILSGNTTLYAQWEKKKITYGDLNMDNSINEDDYLLLENHLNGLFVLDDEILLNADVNGDSKVDEVDLDILKQVNLGTLGYVGYLPNEIVPIYEIYVQKDTDNNNEDDKADSNEEDKEDIVMGSGGNGHTSGNGNGIGGTGNGNSSTGNGGNSVKPSTGTNKPNNNSSNNNINEDKKELFESRTYKFKFIVDDIEYDNTKCVTENSKNCKLVLPEDTPIKKGYIFNGWSNEKDCPSNIGINYSILMENDSTYYACFLKVEEKDKIYSVILVCLLIFVVWVLAIYGIVSLIKRFKKTEIKN